MDWVLNWDMGWHFKLLGQRCDPFPFKLGTVKWLASHGFGVLERERITSAFGWAYFSCWAFGHNIKTASKMTHVIVRLVCPLIFFIQLSVNSHLLLVSFFYFKVYGYITVYCHHKYCPTITDLRAISLFTGWLKQWPQAISMWLSLV